jgi:hypothetical protein
MSNGNDEKRLILMEFRWLKNDEKEFVPFSLFESKTYITKLTYE